MACAYVLLRVILEEQETDYRLTFDSVPAGLVTGAQQAQQGSTISAWKEVMLVVATAGGVGSGVGRGAGGVYLSHGNWFAGVEVGSFEKTSFSLTPSHLSVWKAAGRKGRRLGRRGGVRWGEGG